jgi:hypothetical protein
MDDDVKAVGGQLQGDRSADTGGGSSYQRDWRVKVAIGLWAHECSLRFV